MFNTDNLPHKQGIKSELACRQHGWKSSADQIQPDLQNTLMSGVLLQLDQAIQYNQLDIVVALLDDQVDVALRSSLNR